MKKALVFVSCIFLSIIIASLFGVLHNQFTYTISEEFFTQVLFERFGFVEYGRNAPRLVASIIGVWCVWWIGFYAGILFGFVGLFSINVKTMTKSIIHAILIMLGTTAMVGLLGLCYGYFGFSKLESTCCFTLQIENVKNFIAAVEMHNFSYAGGAIGALIAVLWQLRQLKIDRVVQGQK